MKQITQASYSIAKALHHVNAAKFYFGYLVTEQKLRFEQKAFFKNRIKDLERILSHIKGKAISFETYNAINEELQDPLMVDSVVDAIIALEPSRRELVSDFINKQLDEQTALSSGIVVDTIQVSDSTWVCRTNKPYDHTNGATAEDAKKAMREVLLKEGIRSETVLWHQPQYIVDPLTC